MMSLMEAIQQRHSVRTYTDRPIEEGKLEKLREAIAQCNQEGSLTMRLMSNEPMAFNSTLARYGKFANVTNYIMLTGLDAPDLDERCGYYGEKIVLLAQQLGLNTCWVALTFKKRHVKKMLQPGERLALVIAVGYGIDGGRAHKIKDANVVASVPDGTAEPDWFKRGVEAALLAPTAVNQQKFNLALTGVTSEDGKPGVSLTTGSGPYTAVDLGIVRLHFEIGAGTENFSWERPL